MRQVFLFVAAVCAAVVVSLPVEALGEIVAFGRGTEVTCGTEATALDDATVGATNRHLLVCNPSSGALVYLGGASVTTATGLPLRPGDCWHSGERVRKGVTPYCIAASASAVRVWGIR